MAALLDRYPFNSPWVRRVVARWGLGLWFGLVSTVATAGSLGRGSPPFFDAQLYVAASRAWLAGGNPWTVEFQGILYAAPPPSLVLLAPFAALPGDSGWILLGLLCVTGAVLTVRMLHLPWWWLLFPPLVMAALSGNVQALLIPLILVRAGGLGGMLKVYGIVPDVILGRWLPVLSLTVMALVTAPFLPWGYFLAHAGEINAVLAEQSHYGFPAQVSILLAPLALAAMWVVGRERAAWLAVPALWPSQQWYYATLAMPARSALAAFVISLPLDGSGTLALLVLAAVELWKRRRARTRRSSPTA
jgi:hypothetical protein